MGYFRELPNLEYLSLLPDRVSSSEYVEVKNLFKRVRLREDFYSTITNFEKYQILDGERPDHVAFNYYDDVRYAWLVLATNNILDPYWEWPLSYKDFREYVSDKYGSIETAKSQIHHYEYIARARAEKTGTSDPVPEYKLEIDYQTYTETDVDEREIIYAYNYEKDLNETKREIQLIDAVYIQSVQDEVRGLFR